LSGPCNAFAPEYAKAATRLAKEKSDILLGKVDASKESELAKKYEVSVYPTLKFFRNGKPVEYSDSRTADDIIKWLEKKTGPPAVDLSSAEDAKEFKESADIVILGVFSDRDSADAKVFLEVAAENEKLPFGITVDKSVVSDLGVDKEGIVLFKKFDEGRNDFEEEVTADAFRKFITVNSFPLVVQLSQKVCI
jgi:protein disulfide-isomerase A1